MHTRTNAFDICVRKEEEEEGKEGKKRRGRKGGEGKEGKKNLNTVHIKRYDIVKDRCRNHPSMSPKIRKLINCYIHADRRIVCKPL